MALGFLGGLAGPAITTAAGAPVAPPTREPAPGTPSEAGPLDTLERGEARVPDRAAIQAGLLERQTREQLIDGMLARDTSLPGPGPEERQALHGDLGRIDSDVLRFVSGQGVKLQVVHPGEDLGEARVLRRQDPEENQRLLPARAAEARELGASIEANLDRPMQELTRRREEILQRNGLQPWDDEDGDPARRLQGTPAHDEIQALDERARQLRKEQGQALGPALEGKPYKLFGFGTDRHGMDLGDGNTMPASTAEMAEVHGARTPEERAGFEKTVEALNGPRLQAGRDEHLALARETYERTGDPGLRERLDLYREHPEQIPINLDHHHVLVPETFYHRPAGSPDSTPPTLLDEHDKDTVDAWSPKTRDGRVAPFHDPKTFEGSGLLGQYFSLGDVNRVVVRSEATGDGTPTHEVGHAVHLLVEKQDPAFTRDWTGRLEQAFQDAGQSQQAGTREPVSAYSRTNRDEYFAEGFRAYHEDPKLLKSRDAALFGLVEEMNAHAGRLGRQEGPPTP